MQKTGLVLGGGGAKGGYEIGVWMALRDLDIEPEITGVSGTSIGALNMALFAQKDLTLARTLWENLSTKDIIQLDMKKVALGFTAALAAWIEPDKLPYILHYFRPDKAFGGGLLSRESINRIISKCVDPLKIMLSPLELYACCYRISKIRAEYFRIDKNPVPVTSVLLASAAIPGAFDAVKINGHWYFDGGLGDNVPIRPLYDAGYRRIIAINLSPWKQVRLSGFSDAQIYLITPQKQELFKWGLEHVLDFDSVQTSLRIMAGYQDAVRCLAYFPALYRRNLYEERSQYRLAKAGQVLSLENGYDITINKIELHNISDSSYVLMDVSTLMTERADYGDSSFLLANIFFLVFPDGTRSYADLNLSGGNLYQFPQYHIKGQALRGYAGFRLPEGYHTFSLIIVDFFNHSPAGISYYMDFKLA